MTDAPTAVLIELLLSTDPYERDEVAYTEIARRIAEGTEDEQLDALGNEMAERLGHDEIQARSFAALVLADVVERERVTGRNGGEVLAWRDRFAAWYRSERDLRGWDEQLGWLHAIAHGADALGAFGRSRCLDGDDLAGLLLLARDRLLEHTSTLFRDQEDDRLGYAIALVLTRPEVDAAHATAWLTDIAHALSSGSPGPLPAWVSNTLGTLRALYVLADRGFRLPDAQLADPPIALKHRDILCDAIAEALRFAWPYIA